MASKNDIRLQSLKDGISEVAMEELVFLTLLGFEPTEEPELVENVSGVFPMVKYDVNKERHSFKIVDLNMSNIVSEKHADREMINNLFSNHKTIEITKFGLHTSTKGCIIKDEAVKKDVMHFVDDLDKHFTHGHIKNPVYMDHEMIISGSDKVLEGSFAFSLNNVVPHKAYYEKNSLHTNNSTLTKMTLAYMRERNMGLIDIFTNANPVAEYHTRKPNGAFVQKEVDFLGMIDNNLWLLNSDYVQNKNSMQANVINHYRKLLHENVSISSNSANDSASSIMADVVERNAHTPSKVK